MAVPPLLENLMTGWSTTLRKHSVQINAVNTAWQTLAMAGVFADLDPLFVAGVTLALTNLVTVAANLTQSTVSSYDPTKFKLVRIDGQ